MYEVIAILATKNEYVAHCDGVQMSGKSPEKALENLLKYLEDLKKSNCVPVREGRE